MASTYRWIGGTGAADSAANWTLEGGPGNPDGRPNAGDSAIIATGTVQLSDDSDFTGNTIALGDIAGVAALTLIGGPAIDLANPTVDATTIITNAFSPAQVAPEASLIAIAGRFVNAGTIAATGPAGSVFTIDVQQDGTVAGLFANEGSMTTSAGNTMLVATGTNSEFVVGQFGTGVVSVAGTDATFIAVGGMAIGRAGTGRLVVGNDGTVSVVQDAAGTLNAGTLTLGVGSATDKSQTGGTGSATIASGGSLNVQSLLLIGGNGDQGTLAVNGGTVSVTGSVVAGVSTVIGGTTLSGTGTVTVGSGGLLRTTGTVTASDRMVLGRDTGGQGRVTVAGGTIASNGRLVIGDKGTGDLALNAGGTGSANGLALGLSSGGSGTLTVSASNFSSTGSLDVGVDGLGVLRVFSGGTLTTGSGGPTGARLGVSNVGLGLIDGVNALWSVGGDLIVGEQGIGTLNVTSGAVVNTGTFAIALGNGSGGSGDITVGGGGARLVGGALKIANASGDDSFGTLTIETGGTVQVLSATIGAGGVLNMQGGLLDPPTVTIGVGGLITGFGTVDATNVVNDGGIVASGGLLEFFGNIIGGGTLAVDNDGSLEVDGFLSASAINFGNGFGQSLIVRTPGSNFETALNSLFTGDRIGFNFGAGVSIVAAELAGSILTLLRSDSQSYQLSDVGFDTGTADGFIFSESDGLATVEIGCFVQGTRIETAQGMVAVEDLAEGDLIPTVLGERLAPVVWLGRRRIDCARHPHPEKVWPVVVEAHAFGRGLPRRDLWLSPDHAIYVNEVLVPVHRLIDGASIRQVPVPEVTYFHVQLPWHDVVRSEGLPTESFLDTGDRANFENGGGPIRLHPDFNARMWESEGCARLILTGPELAAARAMVRAKPMAKPRRTAKARA